MKLISDSYLYRVNDYGKNLLAYLTESERVNKDSEGFSDIIYAVKKQANSIILKVLLSDKVVLMMHSKGVARAYKVIMSRDMQDKKQRKKVFIDCTGLIELNNGVYKCKDIKKLISYVTTAMVYIIYYNIPNIVLSNATVMKNGTGAFVDMFLYVLGYLKVPVTYADNKERMSFVIAEYFQYCVAGVPDSSQESVYNLAKNISGIKDKKTCDYLHTLFSFTFDDPNLGIDKFLDKFAEVFLGQTEGNKTSKNAAVLTVDSFAQRWMYAYGAGTYLGLECFVPFSQILTDCCNGAFLNQQNTIEKVAGSKQVVIFTNELFKIGSENA